MEARNEAKPTVRTNEEYTKKEFDLMESALYAIEKRAVRGMHYGFDMVSSRAACIEDIEGILRMLRKEVR